MSLRTSTGSPEQRQIAAEALDRALTDVAFAASGRELAALESGLARFVQRLGPPDTTAEVAHIIWHALRHGLDDADLIHHDENDGAGPIVCVPCSLGKVSAKSADCRELFEVVGRAIADLREPVPAE